MDPTGKKGAGGDSGWTGGEEVKGHPRTGSGGKMRGAHSGEMGGMGGKGDRRGRKMGNTEEIETGDPRERIGKRGEVIGDHRERKGGQVTEGGDNKVQEHLSTGLLNRSELTLSLTARQKEGEHRTKYSSFSFNAWHRKISHWAQIISLVPVN